MYPISKELERLLDRAPTELGEALARRHLDMVQKAVKEWAHEEQHAKKKRKKKKKH